MPRHDYILREIERFTQFLSIVLAKLARTQELKPGSPEVEAVKQAASQDKHVAAFLDPGTSKTTIEELIDRAVFNSRNREDLAEFLIRLAKLEPDHSALYYQRARYLLEYASDTVSFRQMQLLEQIPE